MNGDSGSKRVLQIEEGQHYFLEPEDELPYILLRNLGHGGCANVEEVLDQRTGRVFARKVFRIGGSSAERKRIFENEVKVIRRLAPHHHITQIFATYVGRRQVGILLTPVADRGSLDIFLQDAQDGLLTQADLNVLYYSFGCLASGLQFMHAQKVRHKDIKPHNILVHRNSLIYTDFGSSLDYSAATRSVTTGRPNSTTRRYAAPELHDWSPRSSKTDIFSLGCVYFEILSALMRDQIEPNMTPYRDHTEEICTLMQLTSHESNDAWIRLVIEITGQMLNLEPESRPSAETITSQLWAEWPKAFCKKCQRSLSISTTTAISVNLVSNPTTTRANWPDHQPLYDDMYQPETSDYGASQLDILDPLSAFQEDPVSLSVVRRLSSDHLYLTPIPRVLDAHRYLQTHPPRQDYQFLDEGHPWTEPDAMPTIQLPYSHHGHLPQSALCFGVPKGAPSDLTEASDSVVPGMLEWQDGGNNYLEYTAQTFAPEPTLTELQGLQWKAP
ncbi:kinase-like domain-containing protein [Alternaria rosae]|uniref:kinase-like domain-containing protein n=1 Tax=Alternaria rosae TaxID=1187941 RepID=UPI001E8DCE00|nr:kinase-like domain-containing protein [Alternaria rosae]KAH6882129.1 kinase-like domain-containing protein [Alternaria rosae]